MKGYLFILIILLLTNSCKEGQRTDDINAMSKPVNKDSIIKALFHYAERYFHSNSIDSIIALKGEPKYITKISWGEHIEDSLVVVGYDFLKFSFWQIANTKLELEAVILFDKNVLLPGNLSIGKTTRQDILKDLGLPDSDHNDPGRSITESGDTTVYGTESGVGDTVTFTYYMNIDEYAIGLSMTKDTLRKVSWSKNPY